MTRVNQAGRVEVYFPISRWGVGAVESELVLSVEHFLLLADESRTLEELRTKIIDEAQRQEPGADSPRRRYQRKAATVAAGSQR